MTQKRVQDRPVEIIDFTPALASADAAQATNGNRSCKFVLVELDETLCLVFGNLSAYAYHANLVDRFCKDRQIAATWVKEPDLLLVLDPRMTVRGGGYLTFSPVDRKATFSGSSKSYGSFRLRDLEPVLSGDSPFATYDIRVES
jgi:hypothetical protein